MGLKAVNIRIDEDLLESIDKAAKASGQDRSNWIRAACAAALPGSSNDAELLDEVKVVDPRAREVIKDVIARVQKLEAHCFGEDPFEGQT